MCQLTVDGCAEPTPAGRLNLGEDRIGHAFEVDGGDDEAAGDGGVAGGRVRAGTGPAARALVAARPSTRGADLDRVSW
jgi:hypothetical protein